MRIRRSFLLALLVVAAVCLASTEEGKDEAPLGGVCMSEVAEARATEEFRAEAVRFVDALRNRDLPSFLSFLRRDVGVFAVLPMGVFTDYDRYVESQRHWFEGRTGSFDYQVVSALRSGALGVLTVRADYRNLGPGDVPFHKEILIAFTFRWIDGRWIKVQSQNTVIREVTGPAALAPASR